MFYDDLKKKKLKRNEQSFYTLEDETLDRLFCINSELTLTPNPCNIMNFAATNYFYGLIGIEVDAFTAVPSGFIGSYINKENNEFYGTLFLTDTLYVTNDLIKLYEQKISLGENVEVYTFIKDVLSNKDTSLLEKSLIVSSYLKENNIHIFDGNILSAGEKYNKVNLQNCDDNNNILMDIVEGNNENFKKIFDTYIIPGYFDYLGQDRDKNPREQKGQILNEFDRLILLIEMLEYDKLPYPELRSKLSNIVSILNMCSTDYSADVVYNLFKEIVKYNGPISLDKIDEIASLMADKVIPPAPHNDAYKKETRNSFRK